MFGMPILERLVFSYFFLTGLPLFTFTVVAVFLLLQIGLYYFKNKLLINTYLVIIHLIISPGILLWAYYLLRAIFGAKWSLALDLILHVIHLFLFPIVSYYIHLSYSKKAFGGKGKYSKEE